MYDLCVAHVAVAYLSFSLLMKMMLMMIAD